VLNRQRYALDLIPVVAASAYSLRRLSRSWTGAAIRVRRSSDNAEIDIGFIREGLDVVALLAFVGTGNGFVVIWYDQSGNNRNVTQVTASNQPRIVQAGAVNTLNSRPSIYFNGNSWLSSNAPLAVAQAFSVMASAGVPSTGVEYATGGASGLIALRIANTQTRRVGINAANNDFNDPVDVDVLRQYTDTGNPNSMRRNGVDVDIVAGATSISSAGSNLSIGARDGNLVMLGHESELVFFDSALSTPNRQTLEHSQGAYYGIIIL